MQKIVLFIEATEVAFDTPLKIGNLFMNRFAIEENDSSEILKIFELDKCSRKMSYIYPVYYPEYEEGMDQILKILH